MEFKASYTNVDYLTMLTCHADWRGVFCNTILHFSFSCHLLFSCYSFFSFFTHYYELGSL